MNEYIICAWLISNNIMLIRFSHIVTGNIVIYFLSLCSVPTVYRYCKILSRFTTDPYYQFESFIQYFSMNIFIQICWCTCVSFYKIAESFGHMHVSI